VLYVIVEEVCKLDNTCLVIDHIKKCLVYRDLRFDLALRVGPERRSRSPANLDKQ